MSDVWTWVNSINYKNNILGDEDISKYVPYVVNKSFSYHLDSVLFSNEMNRLYSIPNECQYLFYYNTLSKKKRISKWIKSESTENIELIKQYYNLSESKAYEVVDLFSKKEIEYIKNKLQNGGLNK